VLLGTCSIPNSEARILEPAGRYAEWGRVDDTERLATTLCSVQPPPPPRLSASRDARTHGRKLYYLFAKDTLAYHHAKELDQPLGQVLVKESWIPGTEKVKGPLFMMIKTGDADSDAGWIYATTTPDGTTVTSAGKIASCMECHQGAKRDRMFGLNTQ